MGATCLADGFGDDPKSADVSLRDKRPFERAGGLIMSNLVSQVLVYSIWVLQSTSQVAFC